MKVKATGQIRFTMSNIRYRIEAGESYDLPDDVAEFLIERGFAEEVKAKSTSAKKPTSKDS